MCLLLLAWRVHPRYPLVLAANRDEFHERPAAPADWWEDPELLAGRDLQGGGTWLGLTRAGRFGVVTNFRELGERRPGAPSRGGLIVDYLRDTVPASQFLAALTPRAAHYAAFNLLVGDAATLYYFSNRDGAARALAPGLYGLSNHLLDTPWPKLTRTRAHFERLLAAPELDFDALLAPLSDRTPAAAGTLPATGLPRELEQALSAPFIVTPTYGTRCSTALTLDGSGCWAMLERRHDASGAPAGESRFAFAGAQRP